MEWSGNRSRDEFGFVCVCGEKYSEHWHQAGIVDCSSLNFGPDGAAFTKKGRINTDIRATVLSRQTFTSRRWIGFACYGSAPSGLIDRRSRSLLRPFSGRRSKNCDTVRWVA